MQAAQAYSTCSLDEPRRDSEEPTAETYADTLGELDDGYELVEQRTAISNAAKFLTDRERLILQLRFGRELTRRRSPTGSGSRRCRCPGYCVRRSRVSGSWPAPIPSPNPGERGPAPRGEQAWHTLRRGRAHPTERAAGSGGTRPRRPPANAYE
jgi:hypothetical protein